MPLQQWLDHPIHIPKPTTYPTQAFFCHQHPPLTNGGGHSSIPVSVGTRKPLSHIPMWLAGQCLVLVGVQHCLTQAAAAAGFVSLPLSLPAAPTTTRIPPTDGFGFHNRSVRRDQSATIAGNRAAAMATANTASFAAPKTPTTMATGATAFDDNDKNNHVLEDDLEGTVWNRATEVGGILLEATVALVAASLAVARVGNNRDKNSGNPDDDDAGFWSWGYNPTNAEIVVAALERLGCAYVKFGQALASRHDLVPQPLATALEKLHDNMEPFDSGVARDIIRREWLLRLPQGNDNDDQHRPSTSSYSQLDIEALLDSLSSKPVAAASIGQVYRGYLPGYGPVAVKVKRPGIDATIRRDAILLRSVASHTERLQIFGKHLVAAKLADAADEFVSRLFEELDFQREVQNMKTFARLYSHRRPSEKRKIISGQPSVNVVVPEPVEELCTNNVIVMEWLDGTPLLSRDRNHRSEHRHHNATSSDKNVDQRTADEGLELVRRGIDCTLSQLLDTGILHADPHGGNLLRVPNPDGTSGHRGGASLGYLDFGLLSTVPASVRDGLVCAVAQLVFARNVSAVAQLFGELRLLPPHVVTDHAKSHALSLALEDALDRVLPSPGPGEGSEAGGASAVPVLRFDQLLFALAGLVARFEFTLPPYFLNNARALGTLEGMARRLDPNFNVLRVVYPYALRRLMSNPTDSIVVERTLFDLVLDPNTGHVDPPRVTRLLNDAALLSGRSRRRILWDAARTRGGRRFGARIAAGMAGVAIRNLRLSRRPWPRRKLRYFKL